MREPARLSPAQDATLKRLSLVCITLGLVLAVCLFLVTYLVPVSQDTDCTGHPATPPASVATVALPA
ncbi:hypothetical protein ACWEKT_07480 [Nocardia takedensis]